MTDRVPSTLTEQATEVECVFMERRAQLQQFIDMPAAKGRPPEEVIKLKRERLFTLREAMRTLKELAGRSEAA